MFTCRASDLLHAQTIYQSKQCRQLRNAHKNNQVQIIHPTVNGVTLLWRYTSTLFCFGQTVIIVCGALASWDFRQSRVSKASKNRCGKCRLFVRDITRCAVSIIHYEILYQQASGFQE